MKRFVEGRDRRQGVLLPEYLDDYVSEENPVRIVEAFIDELDLAALGFAGVMPEPTGREFLQGRGAWQACQSGSGAPVEPVQRPRISLPLTQLWIGPPAALAAGQIHAGKLKCGLRRGAFHPRRLSGLIF